MRDGQPREIPLQRTRARRRREAFRRRHDSRRRAAGFRQGPVRHPGHAHRRIAAGGENRRAAIRAQNVSAIERTNLCFLGTSVESGSATAVIVATGAQTYFGKMASSLAGQQVETALRQRREAIHLADDPLHGGDGAAGVRHQRPHQARLEGGVLLRPGRGRRAHAGNAADDRLGLPLQGRAGDVAEEGHRQAAQLDPELRRDGRALHRQDRHADHGPRHPRNSLRRVQKRERGRAARRLSHQPFSDRPENVLDRAVLSTRNCTTNSRVDKYSKVDEIPFDFSRRMMSVVVETPGRRASTADQGRAGSGVRQMHALRERGRDLSDGADPGRRPDRASQRPERGRLSRAGGRHQETGQAAPPIPKPTNANWS